MSAGAAPGGAAAPVVPAGLDATLALVRHGESTWVAEGRFQGQGDPELSTLGREQAELTGRRFGDPLRPPALPVPARPPIAVIHSPLRRTASTAAAISAAIGVPPRPEPAFAEISQGVWEGLPREEVAGRWPRELAGWRTDPLASWAPGGESLVAVDVRVRDGLGRILGELDAVAGVERDAAPASARAAAGSPVLGTPNAPEDDVPWAVIVGHDGVFKVALLALLELPLERFWAFPFALAGISVVEIRAGRARLRAYNVVDHLSTLEAAGAAAEAADRNTSGAPLRRSVNDPGAAHRGGARGGRG